MKQERSATERECTPWYPASVNPVRIGVYERDMANFNFCASPYSYWNGEFWCGWGGDVLIAEHNGRQGHKSACQNAPWRGLTKEHV